MARKMIFVSDISGREINDKDAAKVTITYSDARRGQIVLDVNANEVTDLAAKGVQQRRRGRRPKSDGYVELSTGPARSARSGQVACS